jgi:dienelactone hydrolase
VARHAATWWLILLLAVPLSNVRADEPAVSQGPADKPLDILRSFFAEQAAGKRAQLAARFGKVAPRSWDRVRVLLHRAAPFPAVEPGLHTFETRADDLVPAVRYVMRVPSTYKRDSGQAWPAVVGCHGTGGTGRKFLAFVERMLGPETDRYMVVCPDAPQPDVYKAEAMMADYPIRVLDDVRHRVNIDSNRTVLTGYSKGGYTTWGTVLFSPGQWGGAAPMAAWPLTEAGSAGNTFYLDNVLNLDIQAHWGANDIVVGQTRGINTFNRDARKHMERLGARRYEGLEYAGQGHSLKLNVERIRRFVAAARRDPFPEKCRLLFHRLHQGRAYYIRAVTGGKKDFDFAKRQTLRVTRPMDPQEAKQAVLRREAFELDVQVIKRLNMIKVKALNLRSLEVDLCPELLDFDRPINVVVNGRTAFSGKRSVDWSELLETARRTYDFERLVGGRVAKSIAPKGK